MIEEPYRWLEAIGNRREYVHEQLKVADTKFDKKVVRQGFAEGRYDVRVVEG